MNYKTLLAESVKIEKHGVYFCVILGSAIMYRSLKKAFCADFIAENFSADNI